jgi:hypothetical protein
LSYLLVTMYVCDHVMVPMFIMKGESEGLRAVSIFH